MRGAVLGFVAGAALFTLPGRAGVGAAVLGALVGAVVGARLSRAQAGFSPWSLLLLAFFVPVFALPLAPGADMAMQGALARGLLDGGPLSPAWGPFLPAVYPRGFAALLALFAPLGIARASLAAAALAYVVFWAGLAAVLAELRTPSPRTVALLAVLLSRAPQIFFDWGGNPTVLAMGLGLCAVSEGPLFGALLFAGAAAVHPMGACVAAVPVLVLALAGRNPRAAACLGGLAAVVAAVALLGPHVSPEGREAIRRFARAEALSPAPWRSVPQTLGDPAVVATLLAAAVLLWKRQVRPVALAAAAVVALCASFPLLPLAYQYPGRYALLLLVAVTPLWGQALPIRHRSFAVALVLLAAIPGHLRWYQGAVPMATEGDLKALACVARTVPKGDVIDGAYGDATQWIPALADRAVTHPHGHIVLFEHGAAAPARWRFVGERLRYGTPADAPQGAPSCDGKLYHLAQ